MRVRLIFGLNEAAPLSPMRWPVSMRIVLWDGGVVVFVLVTILMTTLYLRLVCSGHATAGTGLKPRVHDGEHGDITVDRRPPPS